MDSAEKVQCLLGVAMRSRIMISFAQCSVAERHLRTGREDDAVKTIGTIRDHIQQINVLLDGPQIPSSTAIREAAEMVAELETRFAKVEASIG